MPRFSPGQRAILAGGTFATVTSVAKLGTVYVRKDDGTQGAVWPDLTYTRAEAARNAAQLLVRIAGELGSYQLVDACGALAPHVEQLAQLADQADREVTA